jgi:hypothetical protein
MYISSSNRVLARGDGEAGRWSEGARASVPSAAPEAGRVVAWWEEPARGGGVSCAG